MPDYYPVYRGLYTREGNCRGRIHRVLRCLDLLRSQASYGIPTPVVHGRSGHRTLRRQHRQAERRFGWGRETVLKGLHEFRQEMRCLENFAARGRLRSEEKDPQLAADIRAIVEPHTYADPQLKSSRRYTNLSAAEVRAALIANGHSPKELPSERTLRDILNRMNYRLKRIQKGKPLKKTEETDAIFANVKEVRQQARSDPETLEISMDTKAKVALGDYARGGKNED